MNRLEIVHLRSSREPIEALCNRIRESIGTGEEPAEVVTLHRRVGLGTDIAVHIHHLGVPGREGPSALACHLTSALRAYGLVEYTVWEEMG